MIYCHENTQGEGAGFLTKKTTRRKRCSWQSPCFRVGRTATSGTYTRRWIAANWEGENSPLDTSVGWLWHRAQKPPAQRSPQPSCTRARRAPSYYGETGNLAVFDAHFRTRLWLVTSVADIMGTGSTGSQKQGASCHIDVETDWCYRGDIRIFNFRLSTVGSLSQIIYISCSLRFNCEISRISRFSDFSSQCMIVNIC